MTPALGVQLWGPETASLQAKAVRAESLGFASITVPDHLVPGLVAPLTACAIIASATERVHVGTLVLNNDFRHPVVLAREAAALADLAAGRFELGLGSGHARVEYERAGMRFAPGSVRAARLRESAQILRGLFAGDTVTFAGDHYTVSGESLSPPPAVPIPILIGGNSRDVQACAARCADIVGLVGFSHRRGGTEIDMSDFTVDALERQLARLRGLAGARFSRLELQVLVQWHEVTPNRRAAAERAAPLLELPVEAVLNSPYVLLGTTDEIATQIREQHEQLGITRWTVFGDRPDVASFETLAPVLELLAA